jgi:uncharacterized membrane protein YcjF (UPF0283 family)
MDEGAARPVQAPAQVSRITAEDWERVLQMQAEEVEADRQRIEEELAADEALFRLPAFVASPLVVLGIIAILALLGLFIFSQVTSTLAALSGLPFWMQYAGWTILGLLTGAVIYAVGRLAVFYFSLRPNQPVKMKSLSQLAQRTRLRRLVQEKKDEARAGLQSYLEQYPLTEPRDRRVLAAVGLLEEHLKRLEAARSDLTDTAKFAGNDQWLADFTARFQAHLDEAAKGRVNYYATRSAVMTAASPNALIDTLLTGYCSFALLGDLCRIYNLRVSRLGTAVLLFRVFFNSYLAGQLNELEAVTETGIQAVFSQSGVHLGSLAMDAAAGKVLGKVGARAASGMLNYLLLRRLGLYAVKLLRPVNTEG